MSELGEALRKITAQPSYRLVVGKVVSVNDDDYLVDVEPVDGGPIVYDVRLLGDGTPGFVSLPTVGSQVVIGWLSEAAAAVVGFGESSKVAAYVKRSEVEIDAEGVRLKSATAAVECSSNGVVVANGPLSLKSQLDGIMTQLDVLCTGLTTLTTISLVGPTIIAPTHIQIFAAVKAALLVHKQALNQILDD